eukprot:TRINITY_DN2851_c0_g1_i1.p1 TRINITY_DN2851_c0_g1~~TRINITY_DN2851_c0_g1_i1.p1  ORF type:complete len:750 (+),score=159.42 TRINITY_DN2851_c0_g1_i1:102-2351(+)
MAAALLRALVQRTFREADTAEELRRKQILVPVMLGVGCVILIVYPGVYKPPLRAFSWGVHTCLASTAALLVWVYCKRTLPMLVINATLLGLVCGALFTDLGSAAEMSAYRPWTFVVVVMDLHLALDTPYAWHKLTLCAVIAWTITFHAEDAFRLGLYDVDGFTKDAEAVADRCGCASPPCRAGFVAGFSGFLPVLVVLLGDYFATRSFAEGLRAQRAVAEVSVEVADLVAKHLVIFDLAAAREALTQTGDRLPPRLAASFHRLVSNLASYRAFLPESCLADSDAGTEDVLSSSSVVTPSQDPPVDPVCGGATGVVVWDADPEVISTSTVDGACQVPALPQSRTVTDAASQRHRSRDCVSMAAERLERSGSFVLCSPLPAAPKGAAPRLSRSASVAERLDNVYGEQDAIVSPSRRAVETPRRSHVPQLRRVSLLVCNRSVSLADTDRLSAHALSAYFADEVAFFCAEVKAQSGVTDLLAADSFLASFGAVKALGRHSRAATQAAMVIAAAPPFAAEGGDERATTSPEEHCLAALPRSGSVTSGRALCGDFGSPAVQRFMVIGPVRSFAAAAGLAAAAWCVGALIDTVTHMDVTDIWACRLRKRVYCSTGNLRPVNLWEVVEERVQCAEVGEWMYQLGNMAPSPWEEYNAVVDRWCADRSVLLRTPGRDAGPLRVEEDRSAAHSPARGGGAGARGAAGVALEAVAALVQRGCPPPVGVFTAEAFAGRPAPLSPRSARIFAEASGLPDPAPA